MQFAASSKNQTISATIRATKQRRESQVCRQYELKVDKSHLGVRALAHLNRLFLEAKWFYNHVLASGDIFAQDYRINPVLVKVHDGHFEDRQILALSSQMRQEIIDRMRDAIKSLATLKAKGHKVGSLKFKSSIGSIPLKQYGVTYWFIGRKFLRIQGLKSRLRIRGLNQIPKVAEVTSALLIRRHGDFYLHVSTYQTKPKEKNFEQLIATESIGIDLGIANQLTLSNGIRIRYEVAVPRGIRRLARRMSRRHYLGRNWQKARSSLDKRYENTTNVKRDIKNKVVHALAQSYDIVCFQDDNLRGWQHTWGSRMLCTSLGGVISAIKTRVQTPIKVERSFASTKNCSRCSNSNAIGLHDRTYSCLNCGLVTDRDFNAAVNIWKRGLHQAGLEVPPEQRELTPVDMAASAGIMEYLNRIPRVHASAVGEAGSPIASAVGSSLETDVPERLHLQIWGNISQVSDSVAEHSLDSCPDRRVD